ncbi:hypothetical protein BSKO_06668 [Bryopsis sp. KO-2023]|nr:hypothetical protein BSKO_06668 [Bryopsis sp. KO-2023]
MAQLERLEPVLRKRLEEDGTMEKVKAHLRARIFAAFQGIGANSGTFEEQGTCPENIVINELIREYLEFNGYRETLSVFLPETRLPQVPLNRGFLAEKVGVNGGQITQELPLLYTLTAKPDSSPSPRLLDRKAPLER